MSCETAVCMTCLSTDVKMMNLGNTKLQNIFEKLTDSKLPTPGSVCYICYSQLQRCQRFVEMARGAQRVLTQLQTSGIQLIPDSVLALRVTSGFLSTPVASVVLTHAEGEVSVKVEPVDVKEETVDDRIYAVKVEDTTEDFLQEDGYISDDHPYLPWSQIENKTNSKHDKFKSDILQDKYLCNHCQFTSIYKLEFQRHVRKHTKPFHCRLCKKCFSEKSSLIKHESSHSSQKPYLCDHCNKGFAHKTYLKTHLRTHTLEKPFKCDICFKQFAQTGHLITHKRTHFPVQKEMDKTHKCLVCEKLFVRKNGLNRHMKTHTGLRPYSCEFCSKTFAQSDTLKSHVRCHTGEMPYACALCGKRFTNRGNYNRHVKSHE